MNLNKERIKTYQFYSNQTQIKIAENYFVTYGELSPDVDLGVPDVDFRGPDVEKGGSDPRNNLPQQTNLRMQRYRSCF